MKVSFEEKLKHYKEIQEKVLTEYENWRDTNFSKPLTYDLVYLKTDKGILPGWWTGHNWEGRKIKPNMIITHWKRVSDK